MRNAVAKNLVSLIPHIKQSDLPAENGGVIRKGRREMKARKRAWLKLSHTERSRRMAILRDSRKTKAA